MSVGGQKTEEVAKTTAKKEKRYQSRHANRVAKLTPMTSDDNKAEDADEGLHPPALNKDVLGMNYCGLHFGTKEAPAVVQSLYNRKIVGCPGGTGEGHDMLWFWLEKDKPHECAVCSQFFELEVVGIGEQPDDGNCEFDVRQ